jgi:hypothetical protein
VYGFGPKCLCIYVLAKVHVYMCLGWNSCVILGQEPILLLKVGEPSILIHMYTYVVLCTKESEKIRGRDVTSLVLIPINFNVIM